MRLPLAEVRLRLCEVSAGRRLREAHRSGQRAALDDSSSLLATAARALPRPLLLGAAGDWGYAAALPAVWVPKPVGVVRTWLSLTER